MGCWKVGGGWLGSCCGCWIIICCCSFGWVRFFDFGGVFVCWVIVIICFGGKNCGGGCWFCLYCFEGDSCFGGGG